MGCNPQNIKSDTRFRNKHCAAWMPDIKNVYIWIPDINIVYYGYRTQKLCVMNSKEKYCELLKPDINIYYRGYQTEILYGY